MRRTATEASRGVLIPMDIDELKVEQQDDTTGLHGSSYSRKASLFTGSKDEVNIKDIVSVVCQALKSVPDKSVMGFLRPSQAILRYLTLVKGKCLVDSAFSGRIFSQYMDFDEIDERVKLWHGDGWKSRTKLLRPINRHMVNELKDGCRDINGGPILADELFC
ncbi:hypothetical protein L2E82_26864 [Cichorium intybus]|uniref:Uncharacterized protein n=1 Tax=Cichorium intybus TaxID=13427 RepID=A0ACB9CRH2_CICIN|nr:hypothetical protein L2E82_26864 [Cichorium intybus]